MPVLTLAQAKKRSKWKLAVHEAGHAVIALRLGVAVTKATIVGDDHAAGSVHHKQLTNDEQIFVTLAGPMAERIADPSGAEYDIALGSEESEVWPLLIEYADGHGIELDDDADDDAERRLQLHELFV